MRIDIDQASIKMIFSSLLAFINTGIVIVLYKWGVIQFYEMRAPSWMPRCNFCLFFWISFLELCYFILNLHPASISECLSIIALALLSATISRKML